MTKPAGLLVCLWLGAMGCALEITAPAAEPDAGPVEDARLVLSPDVLPDAAPDGVSAPEASVGCALDALPTLEAGPDATPEVSGPGRVLVAGRNGVRDGCTAWYGGRDATALFRAPQPGRYTFSAVGDQLWNLSVRSPCADARSERACARLTNYHGGSAFTVPLTVSVRLEAGEAIALVADGCPDVSGIVCRWTVRAQREPSRGCFDPDRPCAPGQRCVTPPGRDEADSRCVMGHAPEIVRARALRGAGTLRFFGSFRDLDGDADVLRGRLLDADDRPLDGTPVLTFYSSGADRTDTHHVSGVARPTDATQARRVEFFVVDRLGLRSDTLGVPIEDAPVVADGDPCDPQGLADACVLGSACAPAGVCARLVEPTLAGVRAFRGADPVRTALVVDWTDPNDDVDAVEFVPVAPRAVPQVVPVYRASGPRTEPWVTRWTQEVFEGAAAVRVRVRDRAGLWSAPAEVRVEAPPVVDASAACDLAGATARCPAETLCSRYGDPLCREARCVPDVRSCPAGVTAARLTPSTRDGVVASGAGATAAMPTPLATSPCDGPLAGSNLHVFVAPTDGTFRVEVTTDAASPGPSVTLRRRCALGDGASGADSRSSYHGRSVDLAVTMRAGEEVYLFVSSPGVARGYEITVRGEALAP